MPKSSSRHIIHKRKLPGLLLFDAQGRLVSSNPIAEQILREGRPDRLLQKIRKILRNLNKGPSLMKSAGIVPVGPLSQGSFSSGQSLYGFQVFLLGHPPRRQNRLVAVLIQQITSSRFNLPRTQRVFRLSPREVEVVSALQTGMTDKEIASSMGISSETVRGYLKAIRSKMAVSTRTAIINTLMSL